ncbi:MED7 protein-domain-containing protein [Gautieria morchelliformis]|nr:MED7 protein-domain-containing protein [Gautieria morchelliformis]
MEEDQELQNPFPSPPSHYSDYSSHNLRLLSLLKSRLNDDGLASTDFTVEKQHELLPNEKDVPDWPLTRLEKPRVDWILEDGVYNAFGDIWFTKERIPTLSEMGGTQLYPEDPTVDRRPALQAVLRTVLHTYTSFLSSILHPPPSQTSDVPPDWQRLVEWMRIMGQNIMGAANDLRPVQARTHLETMMTRQLELRREETKAVNAKCDELDAKLEELRRRTADLVTSRETINPKTSAGEVMGVDVLFDEPPEASEPLPVGDRDQTMPLDVGNRRISTLQKVTEDDVLRWAEEVT